MPLTSAPTVLVVAAVVAALGLGAAPDLGRGEAAGAPVDGRVAVAGSGVARVGGAVVDPVADVRSRRPPSPGRLLRPFEPPPHEYGPGHRGVDLAVGAGGLVAPEGGTVAFSGQVAGRGVVVVAVEGPDGLVQHSLEPVVGLLPVGTVVAGGTAVARLQPGASHLGCGGACVHWGVRVAGRYVDPWWWLGRTGPVRLLPGPGP